jgi:hypothetical protein
MPEQCRAYERRNGLQMCHNTYCSYVFDDRVRCPIKRRMARRKDGTRIFPNE